MIIVGEALVDLVEEDDGRLDPRPGGSARNVAIAAARLGGEVHYVGGLSTDAFGRRILRELDGEGIELAYAPVVDAPTALAVVTLDDEGVAQYAFHLAGTAALALQADDLAALPGDVPLHVSLGAVTLATPGLGDALVALLASHDALTSFDPNVREVFLTDREADAARVDAAVSVVDLVRCSEEDLELLHPDRTAADVAQAWLDAGAGAVVVTLGAEGALVRCGDLEVRSKVRRGGRSVLAITDDEQQTAARDDALDGDTVGAGDTFGGALLVSLAERGVTTRADLLALGADDWTGVLGFANRAAAITTQRRGADPPHRAEV